MQHPTRCFRVAAYGKRVETLRESHLVIMFGSRTRRATTVSTAFQAGRTLGERAIENERGGAERG